MLPTDFYNKLKEKQSHFNNETFNSNIVINSHDVDGIKFLKFFNCVFDRKLNIRNISSNLRSISFVNCSFKYDVEIKDCSLFNLEFTGLKEAKSLTLHNINLNELKINSQVELNTDIFFFGNVKHLVNLSRLKINTGIFKASINAYNLQNNFYPEANFDNSIFYDFELGGNLGKFYCKNTNILNSALFADWESDKAYFNNSNFGPIVKFNACIFNSIVSFKDCRNLLETNFFLQICIFKGNSFFTTAAFNHFEITDTTFEARASFDGLEVHRINFHLITFQKGAYFDELIIKDINKNKFVNTISPVEAKNLRHTLRLIKQELQKAENKIDYHRFRSYELIAYYKELNWKWNGGFRDKIILGATILSTGFDHSWRRALAFTLFFGLFWYSILYRMENMGSFNPKKFEDYFNGAYRFFLVTDFYSPFENEKRIYLQNGWSGIVMIVGKIFIAFGIYEMIQAFRKFKA